MRQYTFHIKTSLGVVCVSLLVGYLLSLLIGVNYQSFVQVSLNIVILHSLSMGLCILGVLYFSRYMVMKSHRPILILIISFGIVLGGGMIAGLSVFITNPISLIYSGNRTFSFLLINLLFFIVFAQVISGFVIFQNKLSKQENALMAEKYLKSKVELQLLASKINPHFLFNSLNLLISLLKKPNEAETAIINLSEILRHQLDYGEKEIISIELELGIVEKYLSIQKMRFGEKMDYHIECQGAGEIPPFIIQPLVENSIKHNIDHTDHLKIEVIANIEKSTTTITIKDSMLRLQPDMINHGIGLSVTKKRITNFGGDFIIQNGGIVISIQK